MVLGIQALKEALQKRLGDRQIISHDLRRQRVDAIAQFGAPNMEFKPNWIDLSGIPAAEFDPRNITGKGCILYIHGGAFIAGSPTSHAYLAAQIAETSGLPVYALAYRLAPENPHPAAVDDTEMAIRSLADQFGGFGNVSLVGDSAGGTLILLAVQRLKANKGDLHRIVVLSPAVDLRCEGESYVRLASADPFINQEGIKRDVQEYLAGANPDDPEVSPIFSDLSGLPPVLIQVGSDEVLLGDAKALEVAIRESGGTATLQVWPGMIHVWHLFPHYVTEADAAISEIAAFINS